MYRSRNRISADHLGDELADLFARARSNNQRRDITGALLVSDQWFVQVLEGDETLVRSLFERIRTDPGHDAVEVIYTEPAAARAFGHWSMAKVAMPDVDLPLIAQVSEVASGRQMTPAMARLLDRMRASVEDEPDT